MQYSQACPGFDFGIYKDVMRITVLVKVSQDYKILYFILVLKIFVAMMLHHGIYEVSMINLRFRQFQEMPTA